MENIPMELDADEVAIINAWRIADVWGKENVVFGLRHYLQRQIIIKSETANNKKVLNFPADKIHLKNSK